MTHSFPTRRSSDLSATRPGGTGLAQTPCARSWPPSAPRQVGIGREGGGGGLGLTAGGRTDLHGNGGARGHCPDAPAHFCGKDTRSLNPARDDVSPRLRSVGGACSPKRPDAQRDARSVSGGKDSAVVLQQRRFSYLPANNAKVPDGERESIKRSEEHTSELKPLMRNSYAD